MIQAVKVPWSQMAEQALLPALGEDVLEIRRQVEEGEAELFEVYGHGYMVTRIEQCAGQAPELVLVAGSGHGLDTVVPAFLEIARASGIGSVRAHSRRPGMGRMLGRHGFDEVERVYRRAV